MHAFYVCGLRMQHVAAKGPGGLPDKFFSGDSILPGRKFPAQNAKWAKAGRMKVTQASWFLMWQRGQAALHNNPTLASEWSQWERWAKQSAVLAASEHQLQEMDDFKQVMKTLVDDWLEGSPSVSSALDAAIFAQSDDWSITHLPAFNDALLSMRRTAEKEAQSQHQSDEGPSCLDKLETKQKELESQVVGALELTYKLEASKIRNQFMSEKDVNHFLQKKKEELNSARYNESCKAA